MRECHHEGGRARERPGMAGRARGAPPGRPTSASASHCWKGGGAARARNACAGCSAAACAAVPAGHNTCQPSFSSLNLLLSFGRAAPRTRVQRPAHKDLVPACPAPTLSAQPRTSDATTVHYQVRGEDDVRRSARRSVTAPRKMRPAPGAPPRGCSR